ncbi:PRC-barrel domain-containing protein [Desulfopila inferna]|uniref:PRC-barrel domain-containing protein n=1 Tax=Desulfopila inferna TaxID=468528 RepID=UPI00196374F3|nr:PRC-barrel domain-containing protein [Desulfopila inferna]MBM9604929.1 PRC-barrel domain-containing protein [Desulfopila inferna]
MNKLATKLITAAATLAFTVPLYAADEYTKSSAEQQLESAKIKSAEELKGMQVVSQTGDEIGEIKEVRIDTETGEVQFVTISREGALETGEEIVAAPLGAFEFDGEQAKLTIDENRLENVPAQAELSDRDYRRDLETHYGVAPAWEKEDPGDTTMTDQMDPDPMEPAPQTNIDTQDFTDPQKIDTQSPSSN